LVTGVNDEAATNATLERVKDDLAGLRPDELLPVSLDIQRAVTTVFGVLPAIRGLRAQIVKELPTFNVVRFDKLEDYALVLSTANANLNTASLLSKRRRRVVGLREQNRALVAEAADGRLRAYTLLMRTYNDVRRAVAYLRGEHHADIIAPKLHPGRPRPKKRDRQAPVTVPVDEEAGTPASPVGNAS
jgi:hypothetical protein